MTDLKTLFHNPDSLSDEELKQLRTKLRVQMATPYISAAFSGAFYHVCSSQFYAATHSSLRQTLPRVGVVALAGFMFGGLAASQMDRSVLKRPVDTDILHAFEERYIKSSLNVAGYNNNYISSRSNADNTTFSKPY